MFGTELEIAMEKIDYVKATKLAADIRIANNSIDDALAGVMNLTQSMLLVCRDSAIPAAKSQAAIEQVADGISKLVDARKGCVAAHRHIVVVHRRSNLKEINFGCDGDRPIRQTQGLRIVNA
jgi:hypothetical protein